MNENVGKVLRVLLAVLGVAFVGFVAYVFWIIHQQRLAYNRLKTSHATRARANGKIDVDTSLGTAEMKTESPPPDESTVDH